MSEIEKKDTTIKRVIMAVDRIYKHDADDETYAYGFDMVTKEPIRIRLGSAQEFTSVINKLNRNQGLTTSKEDVFSQFDSGRNQRSSIDRNNRGQNVGRIFCFDKCTYTPKESLGLYKAYVSQWCNIMSNSTDSQLIKGLMSINVHQKSHGDFWVKAQIIESASHLQVPLKTHSPLLYNSIIKRNLETLIQSLSNATENQPERIPFSKIVLRYPDGAVLSSIPLIPTFQDKEQENIKQLDKPDPMQSSRNQHSKTQVSYRVAKDPLESITDILNGRDYHTMNYDHFSEPSTSEEIALKEKRQKNVFIMDQARIALSALLGEKNINIYFNDNVDPDKARSLKRMYAGLLTKAINPEIYIGQQIQLGALYKDTFLKKYFNNISPHAGFRKVDPDIDLRNGVGVNGVGNPPLVNHLHLPNGRPKPFDLNPDFLARVDGNVLNKLAHANQLFADAYISIQPYHRNQNNCFISFIEPVELTQSRMKSLSFSELTVEYVQEHLATIDSPNSSNFNYSKLPDPSLLMQMQREEIKTRKLEKAQLQAQAAQQSLQNKTDKEIQYDSSYER